MRKTFGEQYQEYSRSTGALIPKIEILVRRLSEKLRNFKTYNLKPTI